jgi:hypothetical protein
MSIELSGRDPVSELMGFVRGELTNIPIEHWGFFFPVHIAVWRFIEAMRPGVLGQVKAHFQGQPSFEGKGATWFCEELGSNEKYIGLLESIMYPITRNAPPAVREAVRRRGFFQDDEIPAIETGLVRGLADVVLASVDQATADGRIR